MKHEYKISLFFGLPGCGKTTLLTKFALRGVRKRRLYSGGVYSNVHMSVPGYTYIDNECVGRYDLHDCLILIDEATLFANSRDYKSFSADLLAYIVQHRHFNCDIMFFSQRWNSLDLNIRLLTQRVYYVRKGFIRRGITKYYRVPYGILFPSKKTEGEKYGEILEGYSRPGLISWLFAGRCKRKKYYKFFDSYDRYYLPPLPLKYQALPRSPSRIAVIRSRFSNFIEKIQKKLEKFLKRT